MQLRQSGKEKKNLPSIPHENVPQRGPSINFKRGNGEDMGERGTIHKGYLLNGGKPCQKRRYESELFRICTNKKWGNKKPHLRDK